MQQRLQEQCIDQWRVGFREKIGYQTSSWTNKKKDDKRPPMTKLEMKGVLLQFPMKYKETLKGTLKLENLE